MQPDASGIALARPLRFNPHPSRRTGATRRALTNWAWRRLFQSSPVPEDGCNFIADVAELFAEKFQSSPVPEDGCNRRFGCSWICAFLFQSSPVPEDGCNAVQPH